MPRLIVIKGVDEGKQFELAGPVLGIGRGEGNAVHLHDTEISRRHAELRAADEGYRILDIGSANGTLVNTQPVQDSLLRPGDHVQVGQTILVYSAGRTEGPTAGNLADQIRLLPKQDIELSSAIIKTIGESEGSRILARPDQADSPWLRTRLANLAVLYETVQAVSHILDLDQLLERILDLVFHSVAADRGCILLRDEEERLDVKAVRYREGTNRQEKIGISRTITDYVQRERQGVLVSDAAQDERFASGLSIVRFHIREAICVPMKGRHETIGVLYLDTQSTAHEAASRGEEIGKFTEDHLKLAIAIAHQAALAVEETRYHQALVNAERLAAVGQTIAALSHHIKNILQGLRSGSEILRLGLADKNETLLAQGAKIVDKNQAKISELVMDMLSYSKEREPAVETTSLNRIVEEVLENYKGRGEEIGVKWEKRLATGLPQVQVDPQGLERALMNLVGNALDAVEGRPGPVVGIKTELEADGCWVSIIVVDNGPGIAVAKQPDVFKPFFSTKGSKGTGLGLAVSRKILREHGGDITVTSQPGKPTRFTMRVPLRSPLSTESAYYAALPPPVPPDV